MSKYDNILIKNVKHSTTLILGIFSTGNNCKIQMSKTNYVGMYTKKMLNTKGKQNLYQKSTSMLEWFL